MKRAHHALRRTLTCAAVSSLFVAPVLVGAQQTSADNPPGSSREAPTDTNPMRNPATTVQGDQRHADNRRAESRQADQRQPDQRQADKRQSDKQEAGRIAARTDKYGNVRVQELIGMDVRNNAGSRIGDIEDVLIDTTNGDVRYAVMSFGGFMGMGERLYAYPTSAFAANLQTGMLTLKVPSERIKASEGFERDQWPSDASFWDRVESFFTGERQPVRPGRPHLVRASTLLGMDIADRRGDDVGEVHDVVLNLGQRKVQFVVVEFDQAWNPVDKLVAMPMKEFKATTAQSDELVINRDREALRNAPSFNRSRWPALTQGGLRDRYEGYWNTPPTPMDRVSMIEQFDRDGDGVISASEYEAGFARMDANGDGRITPDEMEGWTGQRVTDAQVTDTQVTDAANR
jgi:sporulation protein YlmC with PRC-barrel domain